MKDLSKIQHTVTYAITDLISKLSSYKNLNQLKEDFIKIITNENVYISNHKINEYKYKMNRIRSLNQMYKFICDVHLAGSDMSMKKLKKI
jgi:hypothetical protein